MKEKYKVVIKTLLILLFICISGVALLFNINELEFKHAIGIFMLGIATIGVNNIIFDE